MFASGSREGLGGREKGDAFLPKRRRLLIPLRVVIAESDVDDLIITQGTTNKFDADAADTNTIFKILTFEFSDIQTCKIVYNYPRDNRSDGGRTIFTDFAYEFFNSVHTHGR